MDYRKLVVIPPCRYCIGQKNPILLVFEGFSFLEGDMFRLHRWRLLSCLFVRMRIASVLSRHFTRRNKRFACPPTYLKPSFVRPTQPSDGMKKEMDSLVEQLGADGIEAKRQVRSIV